MMERQKEQTTLLSYGVESSPFFSWFVPAGLIVCFSVVLSHGIEVFDGPGYFLLPFLFQAGDKFAIDPVATTLVKTSTPLFLQIFASVLDIPVYHLLVGVITKALLIVIYYLLAWRITRSTLASFMALFILFGVADFQMGSYHVLNLRLPIGFTSNELRTPLYLSFRQVGMVFALVATLFFLNKQFFLSSVFLAFGVYSHPLNSVGFFLSFNLALLICIMRREDRLDFFYAMIKLSVPFFIIILPYVLKSFNTLADVVPMSFAAFWEFLLKNEPDDASTLWYFNRFKTLYLAGFLLTVIAAVCHTILKLKKPAQSKALRLFNFGDMVIPLLLAPWILLLFSVIWELALIPVLPDFLNDIISTLNLKRITTVSAVMYIPIISTLVSAVVLLIIRTAGSELFSVEQVGRMKKTFNKIGLVSIEQVVAVSLSVFILCHVLIFDNKQIKTFKKFINFDHVEYDFFLENKAQYALPGGMGKEADEITLESLLATCTWVKKNTPMDAALIHPTYIKRIRLYCKRQAFLSEKEDGTFTYVNRKYATAYLERFSDIHGGLTYGEMPGTVFEGGEGYAVMRTRYLSLKETDIKNFQKKYPGYDYFMTEKIHSLNFPVLYENEFFRIYDIQ